MPGQGIRVRRSENVPDVVHMNHELFAGRFNLGCRVHAFFLLMEESRYSSLWTQGQARNQEWRWLTAQQSAATPTLRSFRKKSFQEDSIMCNNHIPVFDRNASGRRQFLKATGAAAVLGLAGGTLFAGSARADALTKAQRDQMTPEQIIEAMKNGNERFRNGERKERNYLREQRASAKGQYPAAVLLSCIDSRAPAEVIMDLGIGDIFNCRIAGNVENADILGSMEFACKLAGARESIQLNNAAAGYCPLALARCSLR